MKTILTFFVLLSVAYLMELHGAVEKNSDLVRYVNPLIGTDSDFKLSNGNTYPAIAVPRGMKFWTPQTGEMGNGWGYTYDAYKIRGFKQTHQPSPWINDYAAFSLMQGLVNTYLESGWLPEWASPGHRDCMIGSNSASIIADSFLKGIRGYDIETLYKAILKNSENEGPLKSVGRYGVDYYNKLGFIPCDVDVNENVARTLEYAYADFCIYKLASVLNRPQNEIDTFLRRANNYKVYQKLDITS